MGTPAAGELTPAPGAGHGDEGDASFQGPAQVATETLPEWPKPTNKPTNTFASTEAREDTATAAIENATASIIVLRPDKPETDSEAAGFAIAHPKPEKRLNAKQRAKERISAKLKGKSAEENSAKDGTTPDMTATAKSKADAKAKAKVEAKAKAKAKRANAKKAKANDKASKRKE